MMNGELQFKLVKDFRKHPEWELIERCWKISMLHPEVLATLWELSHGVKGEVLEVGTYVGGATVSLASARPGGRIISIEKGGKKPDHGRVPTLDVLADLKKNLEAFGVADRVVLLEGRASDPEIVARVEDLVGPASIGLIVLDADGQVERDMTTYGALLADGCLVVLDDYKDSKWNAGKGAATRAWVEKALKDGSATELAVSSNGGTWFGQYHRRAA